MSIRRWRKKGETREETRITERKKEKNCELSILILAEYRISIFLLTKLFGILGIRFETRSFVFRYCKLQE